MPLRSCNPVPGGQVAELTVATTQGPYHIEVFLSDGALHAGEAGWWALLAGGSAALLLIGALGGELLTRRIVRPLTRTAETAQRISGRRRHGARPRRPAHARSPRWASRSISSPTASTS